MLLLVKRGKKKQHPSSTHIDETLLLLVCHLGETEVSASQVVFQTRQGVHHHPLHLPALCPGAGGRQAQTPDAAARPHPGGQHVALVKLARLDLQQKTVRVDKCRASSTGCTLFVFLVAEWNPSFRREEAVCCLCARYLAGIQVGGVLHGAGVVAIVPLLDDRVQQVCKYLEQTQRSTIKQCKTFLFVMH